ncbi:hypothetical protein E8E13_001947 [Curvularia kusanoi]|uniref:Uncharacterized protein n=1 Tax=Curvularia kusanoi TaxID=90978 RepID=A0A9P4T950_CURKU|nr:hypothetical protein E8E13_001947 [Curvularia kusanoi]
MDWLKTEYGSRLERQVESARKQVLKSQKPDHSADYNKNRPQAVSNFRDTWLKAMCSQLYYTLPRELRDMVYRYFVHGQRRLMTYSYDQHDIDEPGRLKLLNSPFHKQMAYWDKEVVGIHMFHEMVEAWYKCAVFKFEFMFDGDMYDYIGRDRWALGIVPATLIKQVTIMLSFNYDVEPCSAAQPSSPGSTARRHMHPTDSRRLDR